MIAETIPSTKEFELIREFCVNGLAMSVPEYMNGEQAADLVCFLFPGDKFALTSLYKIVYASV